MGRAVPACGVAHVERAPHRVVRQTVARRARSGCRRGRKDQVAAAAGPRNSPPRGEIGIGTWAWGNRLVFGYDPSADPELQAVFDESVRRGVRFFDTGDSYGTGKFNARAEQLLGTFLAECPARGAGQVCLATKLAPYPWRVTPGQLVGAARASDERLGGRLGMAQLHWSAGNYAPLQERALWSGLAGIYDAGLADHVGVSNFGPRQLEKIQRYLVAQRGLPEAALASNQIQFSLLSQDPRGAKAAGDALGVTTIAYSPLCLGLLTGKYSRTNLPPGPRGYLFAKLLPDLEPLLDLQREIAGARRKTPAQVAINWTICQGAFPIVGVKNVSQLQENLGAVGWRLSAGEVDELTAVASRVKQTQQNIFMTA